MVSDKYQVESLLRPPVELWSAAVAMMTAMMALIAPSVFFMPSQVAYATAAVLVIWIAIPRSLQARRVLHYQHNLRRLPTYSLRPSKIPVSKDRLFLGLGFLWEQKHTQRLRDTLRPECRVYLEPSRIYRLVRRLEALCLTRNALAPIGHWLKKDHWANPWPRLPEASGNQVIHAVEPNETTVCMPISERVGHTLVLGTTRVGKTRLAEILITQDIHRGDVVIVFDPKGDADLLRRVYIEALRAGRADDFFMFHLGHPEHSARYNAIGSFDRITEVATRIANQLPSEGNAAAFKEFAWRFVNIIARALIALSRRPDYRQIRQHITDIEPLFVEYATAHLAQKGVDGWRSTVASAENDLTRNPNQIPQALRGRLPRAIALFNYIREHDIHDPVLDGLLGAFKYDRTFFDKIVSSVGPLMEKLTTGQDRRYSNAELWRSG